jgi:hypothetical protein
MRFGVIFCMREKVWKAEDHGSRAKESIKQGNLNVLD